MDNLETSLSNTVDKDHGNTGGSIMDSFIKPRASTMFGYPVYSIGGPGPSIAISGIYEEFLNSTFGIWIGGNHFQMVASDQSGCTKYGGP